MRLALTIFLDHALEMLMKSAILHRGGRIFEKKASDSIGFDVCVRRALSDARIKFLTEEQAVCLRAINGLRDAAQHYLLDLPESLFYIVTQRGVTTFRDLLRSVFSEDLVQLLPERVLPLSTKIPSELLAVYEDELEVVRKLLDPTKRRRFEGLARLRSLVLVEGACSGVSQNQPSPKALAKLSAKITDGSTACSDVFPGMVGWGIDVSGEGPKFNLHLTKRDGIPVYQDSGPSATPIAIKRVNELDHYSLGHNELASKVGLSGPRTSAVIWHLNLKADAECYKVFKRGRSELTGYSQMAITRIRTELQVTGIEEIWKRYRRRSNK